MSMLTMILVGVALMAVVAIGFAILGFVRGGAAFQGALTRAREWATARGGSFEAGSFGAWSARGDGWAIRVRATSAAGPRLEGGIHTRYTRTNGGASGVLYIGPEGTDPVEAVQSLLGAPRPLETIPTGDAAFDARWIVAVGGLDAGIVTAEARAALDQLPRARRVEVLVHDAGVEVILLGAESNPDRLDALAAVAGAIAT